MSHLVEHARRELDRLGEDPALIENLVATVATFAAFGHSGGSAPIAIDYLTKLLRQEPLSPITCDPDEWEDRSEMSGYPLWQNLRDSRAMSNDAGTTWWYVGLPGETADLVILDDPQPDPADTRPGPEPVR